MFLCLYWNLPQLHLGFLMLKGVLKHVSPNKLVLPNFMNQVLITTISLSLWLIIQKTLLVEKAMSCNVLLAVKLWETEFFFLNNVIHWHTPDILCTWLEQKTMARNCPVTSVLSLYWQPQLLLWTHDSAFKFHSINSSKFTVFIECPPCVKCCSSCIRYISEQRRQTLCSLWAYSLVRESDK